MYLNDGHEKKFDLRRNVVMKSIMRWRHRNEMFDLKLMWLHRENKVVGERGMCWQFHRDAEGITIRCCTNEVVVLWQSLSNTRIYRSLLCCSGRGERKTVFDVAVGYEEGRDVHRVGLQWTDRVTYNGRLRRPRLGILRRSTSKKRWSIASS